MKTLILNDLHLGVKRQAGTTKQSRKDLEEWMLKEFEELLNTAYGRVLILGDLFDKRNVDEHIMHRVIKLLSTVECIIVAGNHDLGGIEDHTLSSAEFVARLSSSYWLAEPELIDDGKIFVIPHVHDQETFDHAIQICPDNVIMMVHCNIDSPFAHGDHSLNLSLQQMKDLTDRGVKVISGHEHAKREVMNVTILGNQFPSSIADCLGGDKFYHILEDGELTAELNGREDDLFYNGPMPAGDFEFINITGECELNEYASVVKEVAELRKSSPAFIVKNSVKVKEFIAEQDDAEVTDFNILEMWVNEMPEAVRGEVKKCM